MRNATTSGQWHTWQRVGALHILAVTERTGATYKLVCEPSACNFEVIFNVRVALVFQPRQLSVVALQRLLVLYNVFALDWEEADFFLLLFTFCQQTIAGNKKPLHLRGFSNIASSPHLAATL